MRPDKTVRARCDRADSERTPRPARSQPQTAGTSAATQTGASHDGKPAGRQRRDPPAAHPRTRLSPCGRPTAARMAAKKSFGSGRANWSAWRRARVPPNCPTRPLCPAPTPTVRSRSKRRSSRKISASSPTASPTRASVHADAGARQPQARLIVRRFGRAATSARRPFRCGAGGCTIGRRHPVGIRRGDGHLGIDFCRRSLMTPPDAK